MMNPNDPFATPEAPRPRIDLPKVIPATFTGEMRDYLRIYYMNLFLSVITVGVYSAWATVRNRRFLYGHTSFLGFAFDFDAKPRMILRLCLIAFVLVVAVGTPLKNALIGFLLLFPLLVVLGRSFKLRHTLWRGTRFSYAKRFWHSYAHFLCFTIPQLCASAQIFLLLYITDPDPSTFLAMQAKVFGEWTAILFPAAVVYSVFLWPVGDWWRHHIRVSQMGFGKLKFKYAASLDAYAEIYIRHLFVFLVWLIALMLICVVIIVFPAMYDYHQPLKWSVVFLCAVGAYAVGVSYFAHTAPVFWNGIATTEESKLQASFKPIEYAYRIIIPNHLLLVASLGLLLPYARMRRWRYLAAHVAFKPSDKLREAAANTDDMEAAIASATATETAAKAIDETGAPASDSGKLEDAPHSLAPPAPPPSPVQPKAIPVTFTGKMRDYFRLYCMNAFLSVITLGVYSVWATVRNRRLLYGHTSLLGFAFDFDAKPRPILIFRNIAIALIALRIALEQAEMAPALTHDEGTVLFSLFLLFVAMFPLFIALDRSFNLRHSIWRGVRFSYTERLGPSYAHLLCFTIPQLCALVVIGVFLSSQPNYSLAFRNQEELFGEWISFLFLALVLHLVVLWPIGSWWSHRIRANQMGFGKLKFRHDASLDEYIGIYLTCLLLAAGWLLPTTQTFHTITVFPALESYEKEVGAIAGLFWMIGAYALGVSYAAHSTSVFLNGISTTEGSKLQASFKPLVYAFRITIPNHLIIVASLGLLLPYARMRRWRYLAAHVAFMPSDSLREAVAGTDDMEAAIASATAANTIDETSAIATDSGKSEDAPHSHAPPAPQPSPALPKVIPATFTGKIQDYFRIYFTNVFLGIITLGVYTAWAKVRNRRFFYGHTSFLGFVFDFDAKPLSILISRFIVATIFFWFLIFERHLNLTIGDYGFAGLAFLLLFPLLVVRGRSFNLRHSLWRGVRFSYTKLFGPSYAHLICFTIPQLGALSVIALFLFSDTSFGITFQKQEAFFGEWTFTLFFALVAHLVLLWPIGNWWRHRIRASQMSFGKLKFRYDASIKAYAGIYATHLLILAVWTLVIALVHLNNYASPLHVLYDYEYFFSENAPWLWPVGAYAVGVSYIAHTAFVFWNGIATTEDSKVQATFKPLDYAFWITIPNHLITVASLGLLLPYARMRRWRYLAAHIAFLPSDSLRETAAGVDDVETAIASEAVELEGYDLDLGMI